MYSLTMKTYDLPTKSSLYVVMKTMHLLAAIDGGHVEFSPSKNVCINSICILPNYLTMKVCGCNQNQVYVI